MQVSRVHELSLRSSHASIACKAQLECVQTTLPSQGACPGVRTQVSWAGPPVSTLNSSNWYSAASIEGQEVRLGSVVTVSHRGQQFGLVQCMWEDAKGQKQAQVGVVWGKVCGEQFGLVQCIWEAAEAQKQAYVCFKEGGGARGLQVGLVQCM